MATNKKLIDEYLELNESVINLLIYSLGTVHILAFLVLLYACCSNFFFIPFSSHKDSVYYIGLYLSELSHGSFLMLIVTSVIGYLLVFGFISLMVGIYQKIRLLNQNLLEIAFDTNVNLRASILSGDDDRKVSRQRGVR